MSAKVALGWSVLAAKCPPTSVAFVGVAYWPTTRGADAGTSLPVVLTPPGGMANGDFVIVVGHTESNVELLGGPWAVSNTGGQTWSSVLETYNSGETGIFTCHFNGTWSANPSFTHDGFMSPASIMAMYVFRGVHASTPWDDGPHVDINTIGVAIQPVPKAGGATWASASTGALAFCVGTAKDIVGTVALDAGWTAPDGSSDGYWNASATPGTYYNHQLTLGAAIRPYGSATTPITTNLTFSASLSSGCLVYGTLKKA